MSKYRLSEKLLKESGPAGVISLALPDISFSEP